MKMKLLKLQISSDILSKRGHPRIFEFIKMVEIQNILQYDPKNLFLQAKLTIKDDLQRNYQLLEKYATIRSIYILKEIGQDILCLMSIATEEPLWPDLGSLPWAIIPPVFLDPISLHFNFIISEATIPALQHFLSENAQSHEFLVIENMDKNVHENSLMMPNFTTRQLEITRHAYRNGYFESPKQISSEVIANQFNISTSAVTKNLRNATKKTMKYFFS